MDEKLKPILTASEVRSVVKRLAGEISADYGPRVPVLVGVLKGSFVFLADLVRFLSIPVEIDFIQANSYGMRERPLQQVNIDKDHLGIDISGRDVLIVEDIADRCLTLKELVARLQAKGPASLKTCVLFQKVEGSDVGLKLDYLGATVGGGFVVGYGLDYKERYRELPGIYTIDT